MARPTVERIAGAGWLALLGGGELTFGETEEADRAWLERTPEGVVGFLPTASGSTEYGGHFATYLGERFGRTVETIPIYRTRDARRAKNHERMAACAALYLGGGVTDHLLEVFAGSSAGETLAARLGAGATVIAIAAAAQALGAVSRSLLDHGRAVEGLGWLPGGALEPNFDPGHDHRLRQMLEHPAARWGLGIPAESAVLLGPAGEVVVVGEAYVLADPAADLEELEASA